MMKQRFLQLGLINWYFSSVGCFHFRQIIGGGHNLEIIHYSAPLLALSVAHSLDRHNSKAEYDVFGMKCNGCVEKIQSTLRNIDSQVYVQLTPPRLLIDDSISLKDINKAIQKVGPYHVKNEQIQIQNKLLAELSTFSPLLIIMGVIFSLTILQQRHLTKFDFDLANRHFMGFFFLIFSLCKLLNLKGFVEAYSVYDLLAQKVKAYAWIYPFIELIMAILYLENKYIVSTHVVTIILMSFSSLGVLVALLQNKKLTCACLGSFFKLPMTYITLVEDLSMVLMAIYSLIRRKTRIQYHIT